MKKPTCKTCKHFKKHRGYLFASCGKTGWMWDNGWGLSTIIATSEGNSCKLHEPKEEKVKK